MSKYNIDSSNCICPDTGDRMWEVASDGRVWPCCFFSNAYDKRHMKEWHEFEEPSEEEIKNDLLNTESRALFDDPVMSKLLKEDPEFNNLEHHTLEDIINLEIYNKYTSVEGWESDNPPLVCIKNCNACKS